MNNATKKFSLFVIAVFLAAFLFFGGWKLWQTYKQNNDALNNQLTELKQYKNEQQQKEYEMTKKDCEQRLAKVQDGLTASQRDYTAHQQDIKDAEAGINGYSYQACLKSHECDKGCTSQTKNDCKQLYEDNMRNIRSYVQEDLEGIENGERLLVEIKNECDQYFN